MNSKEEFQSKQLELSPQKSKPILLIEQIDWEGTSENEKHFLYQETPRVVKSKIQKIFDTNQKPPIPKESLVDLLCSKGDILIYPDKSNIDEAEEVYQILTDAIASLSFVPGGIDMFGYHYEVKFEQG